MVKDFFFLNSFSLGCWQQKLRIYIFPVVLYTVDWFDPVGFGIIVEQSTIEGVFGIDWKARANGTNGDRWISNDNMREVSRLRDWWLRIPSATLMPIVKFFSGSVSFQKGNELEFRASIATFQENIVVFRYVSRR